MPMATVNPLGLDGLEFIEFASPDLSILENLMSRLGMKEVAHHKTKAMRLFRQNDVNFIINNEPNSFAMNFTKAHGPAATAMAVRVHDAKEAFETVTYRRKKRSVRVAQSFINFLKTGSTRGAVNFPNVDLPVLHKDCHRIVNVHRNVPGVLSEINGIVSEVGANIEAQSLATDPQIGYLVMDMAKVEAGQVAQRIAALETSIKTRVLF